MTSLRYTTPLAVLLGIALIPTVLHSYWGAVADDGRTAAGIPASLAGAESMPTSRRAEWVKKNFDTTDWIERVYRLEGHEVVMFVARSLDAKRLYHHPEIALLRSTTEPRGITRASARRDVPLHVLKSGRDDVAVYALVHDGRFVANPITFQLRNAFEQMFTTRKPMTLFLATSRGSADDVESAPATRILLAAVESFHAQVPFAGARTVSPAGSN